MGKMTAATRLAELDLDTLRLLGTQAEKTPLNQRHYVLDQLTPGTRITLPDFNIGWSADIKRLLNADAVAVLPGWEESKTTTAEALLASHLSKPVIEVDYLNDPGAPFLLTHKDIFLAYQKTWASDDSSDFDEAIGNFSTAVRRLAQKHENPDHPILKVVTWRQLKRQVRLARQELYEAAGKDPCPEPLFVPPVLSVETNVSFDGGVEPNVLEEADEAVNGERNQDYGPPSENHGRTAAMWSAYLGTEVTAEDVCMLNILQKTSRAAHSLTRDTLVDIAGYAENAERCAS